MTVSSSPIKKHAVRLLNPFRGVMNIIEYEGAEAVTIDGLNWDIYVKDMSLTADLEHTENVLITEIRFGHWSRQSGLTRGPIYPSEDFKQMELQGIKVYEYLIEHHEQIPFALTDCYELWLLDQYDLPLALLSSTYSRDKLYFNQPLSWTPGNACKQYFQMPIDGSDELQLSNAEHLESYVKELSGHRPSAQWFRREDSHAVGLYGVNLAKRLQARTLSHASFPEYLVRDASDSMRHRVDFALYLNFLSPYLLTLPDLTHQQRLYHEKSARFQALCVDRLYRLYPEICEQKYINAARVEARLRKTRIEDLPEDKTLSPEYIELGASRTN